MTPVGDYSASDTSVEAAGVKSAAREINAHARPRDRRSGGTCVNYETTPLNHTISSRRYDGVKL